MGSHFLHHSMSTYLVDRDFAKCAAIRNSPFGAFRNWATFWQDIDSCRLMEVMQGQGDNALTLVHIGVGFSGLERASWTPWPLLGGRKRFERTVDVHLSSHEI